ncbi:MAG: MBL fold metallo-hydrolase [Treponema sp.]|nr:MBL fold metallo-hydrolase [Treponema sp.]
MRWTVLSLGYFSRNRYWGEDEGRSYRSALCTSTFVEIGGKRLVIDPPAPPGLMGEILDQRTGLKPEAVDYVFITHKHGDHFVGLEAFPNALLLAPPEEWDDIGRQIRDSEASVHYADPAGLAARLRPAGKEIMPGVAAIPLPGHTMGLTGAVFEGPEGRIVAAGDAVMTADHFFHRQGYYNSVDFEISRESIEKIAGIADLVVPGHGNYFLTRLKGGGSTASF